MKDVIEGQELYIDDAGTDAEILEVVLTGAIAKPANQVADKIEARQKKSWVESGSGSLPSE
jgi:hypothetical protein